jgi:trehalose 6-phosphate phosphatase
MLKRTRMIDAAAAWPRVDLESDALLFDLDGTLLDIAATPEAVIVPAPLRATLARLSALTGGALAVVTGRTVETLDDILAPLRLAAIGCHGAQFRLSPNGAVAERAAKLPDSVRRAFADIAARVPGVLVEDKGYAIVFHYRAVPERGPDLAHLVRGRMKDLPPDIAMLHGKGIVELKPNAVDKGRAVLTLMTQTPFLGRRPVFAGDDTTDEDVFAVLPRMNGLGISVGRKLAGADMALPGPQAMRDWLAHLAGGNDA